MFEAQLAFYLQKYLGAYLHGLDAESLKISVWRGDVELRNLALKAEALQDLELPICVRAGLLGKLTIKIPWSKLGREPVVVEFDRLYILAGPRRDEAVKDCKSVDEYEEQSDRAEQEAKKARIDAAEAEWLQDFAARTAKGAPAAAAGKGGAFNFNSLIDPILGNLQLRLTNLHIRYEDDVSYPGHPLAVGLTFRKISAYSVDDEGKKTFVTHDALQHIRKAANLQKLCIYFDANEPFLAPPAGKKWASLTVGEWDALFLPDAHDHVAGDALAGVEEGSAGGGAGGRPLREAPDATARFQAISSGERESRPELGADAMFTHQHLILPVSGNLKYTRRAAKFRKSEADAKQEVELQLERVSLRFSRAQYAGMQRLLEMLDGYQANSPYRMMRPRTRPAPGVRAKIWWHYAVRATLLQLRRHHFSWGDLKAAALMRKRYVPLYVRCLQNKKVGGDEVIAAMDRQLQEGSVLLFRRMAHTKVESERRRAGGPAGHGGGGGGGQQRTWGGWLFGAAQGDKSQHGGKEGAQEGADLSPEEWAKLEELVSESESKDAEENSKDSPTTLRLSALVRVATLSLRLVDDAGACVVTAALATVTTHLRQYPRTQVVSVYMGRAGIDSPHGALLSCGYIPQGASTAAPASYPLTLMDVTAGGASASEGQSKSASAFSLDFTQRPQDGSADAVVRLNIAPSYVTFLPRVIAEVGAFFKLDSELELSSLQAQAAARTEQLRRMAALQLRTLGAAEEKPKLLMALCMHAPKVAIPSEDGSATLILDLGLFKLTSSPEVTAALPSEEAALYQCFRLEVESVAAYLFDGAFAWPSAAEQEERSKQQEEQRRRTQEAAAAAAAPKPRGGLVAAALAAVVPALAPAPADTPALRGSSSGRGSRAT